MASEKDNWDRLDIVAKLAIPVVVVLVTVQARESLRERELLAQAAETERQLAQQDYAEAQRLRVASESLLVEIVASREEAESGLRKDIFLEILKSFVSGSGDDIDDDLLDLEILASNFHESFDTRPLFLWLLSRLNARLAEAGSAAERAGYQAQRERLFDLAREIRLKELSTLTRSTQGKNFSDAVLYFESEGLPVKQEPFAVGDKEISIYFDKYEKATHRLEYSLLISDAEGIEVHKLDFVDPFVFPMIRHVRLDEGLRGALVMREHGPVDARRPEGDQYYKFSFVIFPGTQASLKDRPYFEDLLRDFLNIEVEIQAFADGGEEEEE